MSARIGVLGAGAWGTALAQVLAGPERRVTLLCRDPAVAAEIGQTRQTRRLPGVTLHASVDASARFTDAGDVDLLLAAVPAQRLRGALATLPGLSRGIPIVVCAKGIEAATGFTMSEVVAQCRPGHPVAVLSGPSFAAEVGRGCPTALAIAAAEVRLARRLAEELGRPAFRLYYTTDVRGVEIGGAAKNVLAIACGMAAGLGLGASASAALIARGFAELSRLGATVGAAPETLMGLSGLGDLVLTCSSAQSRNFSFGHRLAAGDGTDKAQAGGLAEGAATAPALIGMARARSVDMPIVSAVAAILAGTLTPASALDCLLARPIGPERVDRDVPRTQEADPWRTGW